jgi:hypothetical protein
LFPYFSAGSLAADIGSVCTGKTEALNIKLTNLQETKVVGMYRCIEKGCLDMRAAEFLMQSK